MKLLGYLTSTFSVGIEIEDSYGSFSKHERVRIEHWCKKLCEATNNAVWKKTRNLYAMLLLDQVLCGRLQPPFACLPPQGSLPPIAESGVVLIV